MAPAFAGLCAGTGADEMGASVAIERTDMIRHVPIVVAALLCASVVSAQSADQEVVSVVDWPDPVVPGQSSNYTITLRNNGPNAAVNGGLIAVLDQNLIVLERTVPTGWTCSAFGVGHTCTAPSFAPGTVAISFVVTMPAHLMNFPDGTVGSIFYPSGTTPDPNTANNQKNVTTGWNSPQMDLAISVTDTPDPVGPDMDLTYTATVTNNGPDPATSLNFNVYNPGYVPFKSVTPPAGWTCTPPAVGAATIFTCNTASFAAGATSIFNVVVRVDDAVLGVNNGTISTVLSVNGTGDDTNDNNNSETEDTAYVTPKADLAITVADTVDPVLLGQDFDYLVTLTNHGPDAAPNATLGLYNNGSLRYRSIVAPPGFQCTLPTVGNAPILSCATPSLANGASVQFLVTVRTDPQRINPQTGGTVQASVTASSAIADPAPAVNNQEGEDTLVIPVLLFSDGFEF